MNETTTYRVSEMSSGHCTAAITEQVSQLTGVTSVAVDLEAKLVRVTGRAIDEAAILAAIDEAGYEAVRA